MDAKTLVSFRMDAELKTKFEAITKRMGLTKSAAGSP